MVSLVGPDGRHAESFHSCLHRRGGNHGTRCGERKCKLTICLQSASKWDCIICRVCRRRSEELVSGVIRWWWRWREVTIPWDETRDTSSRRQTRFSQVCGVGKGAAVRSNVLSCISASMVHSLINVGNVDSRNQFGCRLARKKRD